MMLRSKLLGSDGKEVPGPTMHRKRERSDRMSRPEPAECHRLRDHKPIASEGKLRLRQRLSHACRP